MEKHILLTRFFLALFISIGGILTSQAQTVIYVNDASTAGDVFTTAVGNDANSGLTPANPVATIAAAVSKSTSGSKILIDAGNYNISSTILNGIKLVGSGKQKTIIDINGGSIQMMSNSELWNLTITKSYPANPSPTISVATNGGENMHIEGCHFSKNRSAIYIEPGTQNLTIKGNTFNDNRTGIIFPGGNARSSTIYVYDNDISNNRTWGIVITDNTTADATFYIANNNIVGNKAGGLNNDNTTTSTKLFLRNNFFGIASPTSHTGTGNSGFTATLHEEAYEWEDVTFTTTAGHPYHISGNNIAAIDASSFHSPVALTRTATTNFISSTNPVFDFHHSIQEAINSSSAGAAITLPDGVYNEDVNVNKSVTINGTSQSGTVILGSYDWQKTVNVFNIGAINVNVSNLTISRDFGGSATGWANSGKNQGLIINSNNATIDKILVKDQRNGIYINNRQNFTLTNSTVKDSRTGLHMVNNVSDATIRNNSFTNNFTHGVMFNADGVALNLTNSIITDNQITGNWFTQLYFHKTNTGGDPILTNSTINCNSFGSSEITINNSAAGEPGYNVQATSQSGGTSTGTAYTFGGNQIENHYSNLSLWRNNSDANTDLLGFQIPSIYTVSPVSGAKSALNNNYRVLANALGCASSGDQITLNGDFDWTETHAQADWAKGMDANSSTTGDNYKIAIQTGKNNIHLNGTTGTRIKGPGDLPEANLESFLSFPTTGVNKNWKISNLEIEGFDLSIYFGSTTSGGADSLKVYNNTFRIPKDLTDDLNQNIGVHLSNGKGIEVYNNHFYIDGTGESGETARSNSNALQSTTSGGTLYDGLKIYNNNITVTGIPHATKPSYIIGFWENSQSRGANIELYNNIFTNEQPGNLPANNRQMAFRVTSRSGASRSVKYNNNEITGFNRGIDWIGDPYSTTYGPLTYEASATPVIIHNNKFDNVSFGVSVRKDNASPNTGSPAIINQNSFTNIGQKAIVYEGNNGITETNCNWFGTDKLANIENMVSAPNGGSINYNLRLSTGTSISGIGFTPNGLCIGTVKNVTKNTFHLTIQEAINDAAAGDEILASSGTYNEQLTINKPITLKGAQAGVDPRPIKGSSRSADGTDESIIEGLGTAQLVNITSSDVIFDGFLLRHTTNTGSADQISSPDAAKENITISNNILLNATDEAIQIRKTNNTLIEKNYVSGSIGDGINVCLNQGGEGHQILDNEVFNSRSGFGSIYLYDVDNVEIKGNYIHGLGQGVNIAAADAYGNGGCKGILVHHNDITSTFTLHPSGAYAVGISGTLTDGVTVKNNNILNTNTEDASSTYLKLIDVANTAKNIIINDNYIDAKNRKAIRVQGTVTARVIANCNWYGTTDYAAISSLIEKSGSASIKSYPFLSDGTDADGAAIGFTPLEDKCTGRVFNSTQNDYYLTIQDAVTEATPGDTLLVSSGTYDEQVLVNKSVVIAKGTGETLPIVKFSGTVTGKPTIFDVSADEVAIDSLRFEVDLTKLKSAVIASAAGINKFTFINNEIYGQGVPAGGNYSDRNAVSVNHAGNTNYRVATGGVDNIVFSNNTVDGEDATLGFFRAALAVDEGAVTAKGNTLRTINHDILVRFNSKNPVEITDNLFNGGGVELAEQNGGSGKITLSDNEFNGEGAPNYALLRVKNNQSGIEHEISNNTFNDYKWAISLENMKNVTVEANTFTTSETAANALVVNTKSISSNSSDIVQTTISATVRDNDFAGAGRGIVLLNHDNQDASFGTFVIGEAGKENKFSSTLSSFIAFDNQTGPSSGSTFPIYGGSTGLWVTPMACWQQNLNAENNSFDVGSGLKSPSALNASERDALEAKLTHKTDFACLGSIQFFNPVHNVTQNTYFSKIQDAVNAAAANDVIELSEWTFTESVEIGKSLTIQGVDKAKVILNGSGLVAGSAFKINSGVTNVTIQNLTIENYNGTNPNSTAGIYAAAGNDGLHVKNVDVKNNTNMSGFYANGPVNGISIDSSSFTNHGPGARGIVVWNGLKSNISLTNNYLSSNNCCGIELQDGAATGVLIKGNTVYAEDSGISAVGLTSGSGNSKANIIDSNFVFVKQRFGIEIKNPNGTGNDDLTEDGAIIVSRNEVTHNGPLTDLRDLAGIAVHRRGVSALNVDVPTGVVVRDNEVSGFIQPSLSTGFGIVLEGTNHTATGNTLTGNDVGIQQQSGHLPYPADGDQNNVDDMYFGRGNSPILCNLTVENNTFSGNTLDQRILVNGAVVTEITPTVDPVSAIEICNNTSTTAVAFTGNTMTGKVYKWTNSHPSIGLAASGTGNIASFTVTNTTLEPIVATITVTPELPNGCKGTPVEFTITVNPTPEKPVINPSESTICEGSEVTLVTTCLVGTAHWSNGMTGSSITVSPVVNTSYTVKCIDALGCEGTVSNAAAVNVIARSAKPTLTASTTTICNGLSVLLTASSCVDGKYIWSTGAETTENTLSVSPASTQNYTVTCSKTATLTCVSLASDPVTITVNTTTLSAPTASGNVLISSGATTTLTATCSTGTPAWFDPAETLVGSGASFTTPALTVNTDYNVRCLNSVTNLTDCKSSAVLQRITIDNFAVVNHPQHIYVCLGQNAFLSVGATGRSITYQWEEFNGTTWTSLTNSGKYSGVNSSLLNIQAPGLDMSDYRYRCVITNTAPDAVAPLTITSNPGVLTISSAAMANNITMVSPITGLNVMYQAVQTIVGTNKVNSGNIKYFAGNSITLEPGFEVTPGSVFTAKIQIPCTNTSSAAPIPDKIKY